MDLEIVKLLIFAAMVLPVTYFSLNLKTKKEIKEEIIKKRREQNKIMQINKI